MARSKPVIDAQHLWIQHLQPDLGEPLNIEFVDTGITNKTYKVTTRDRTYAFRICHPTPDNLGIDRQAEQINISIACQHKLHPPVSFYDADLGLRAIHWVDGYHLEEGKLTVNSLKDLAKVCAELHSIESNTRPLNLIKYQQSLTHQNIDQPNLHQKIQDLFSHNLPFTTGNRLCHMDISASNIVINGQDWHLLDWEYSASCTPWMDLAFCMGGMSMTLKQRELFLQFYVEQSSDLTIDKMSTYKTWIEWYLLFGKYLAQLWAFQRLQDPKITTHESQIIQKYQTDLADLFDQLESLEYQFK